MPEANTAMATRPAQSYPARWRVVRNIALFFGIYGVAVLVLLFAILINVVLISNGIFSAWLLVVAIAAVFSAVAALVATRARFETPSKGYLISDLDQPELLATISEIAHTMRTRQPDEVYLCSDVNAAVSEDTRLLGLVCKKRVLAIGLGLIDDLSIAELRAVLAHEFGHFVGSDTRLTAVSHRGRQTLAQLVASSPSGLVRSVFLSYARFYLRSTSATSRQQELAADAWSVELGGTDAARSALRKVAHRSALFAALEGQYLAPLADNNLRPSNMYRWLRSLATSDSRNAVAEKLASRRAIGPFDSHPRLPSRLAAIEKLPPVPTVECGPARELVADRQSVEVRLTQLHYPRERAWETLTDSESATHLMASAAARGHTYIAAIEGTSSPIGSGAELLRLLASSDRPEISRRLAGVDQSESAMRAIVRDCVIHLAGPSHDWEIGWDNPVAAGDFDIDVLTDALLEGGSDAAHAATDLANLRRV